MNAPDRPLRAGRRPSRVAAIVLGAALAVSAVAAAPPAQALEGAPTVVSITFDDSNENQMTAASILEASGLHATFYTLSGFIGQPGHQSLAQLQQLAAAGHEIGSHTVTHPDMATLSENEAMNQACQSRATLSAWGFQVTSFAYPFASMSPTAKEAVEACGYNSARNLGDIETRFGCTGCGFAEAIPPGDPFELRVPDMVDATWTLADLQASVTNAESTTGGWVGLTFHHVCDDCDVEGLEVTPGLFTQFTQWLAARSTTHNTTVRTVHEVVGGAVKPVVGSTLPPAPGPGVNGVANPGLEEVGDDGVPRCFMRAGFGTNSPTFSTVSPGRTGLVAERLQMAGYVDGDAKAILTMDFGSCAPTVTPGHRYSLRAWYTSSAVTQFAVYLRNAVGGWEYWTSSPWFAAVPGYTQAVWDSDPIPAGYTGISFGLNLFSNGELVTDDYALYDLEGAPGITLPGIPVVTGTPVVGGTLSAAPGTWMPVPAAFSYEWLRNGVAIAGATAQTYTPVAADQGATVAVRITGTPAGHTTATATSSGVVVGVGVVGSGQPTIAGILRAGATLNASPGAWTPAGVVHAHRWLRDGVAIAGAVSPTYRLVNADRGHRISVEVTGSLTGYSPVTRTSAQTAPIQPRLLSVSRIAGPDRFATAVEIAKAYAPGVARVYVANGLNFPDALSAAPAAAHFESPMLLTLPWALPDVVRAEIARLDPAEIIVVGGTGSVSQSVADALDAIAPVTRIAGPDRYATSRLIADEAFGDTGASTVFLATGANFPDALAAAPAASRANGPTVLVPSGAPALDAATRALLVDLGATTVKIAGGPASVSIATAASADGIPGVAVTRLAGPDRYATASAIVLDSFGAAPTSYLATGSNFPDALVGAALAGWKDAPIHLTPGECLAPTAATGLEHLESDALVLFGGEASLGADVAALRVCG
ncbi:cell wall-binding repeat-containing protein [Agromyces sp. LHK192]|uniref:cell wall-binding repeat-containing protein n=1 Tax=Agromyces sp. LHK192 TaxID=2498704 RepID=UPI000FD981A6|nr:cell wall-binding repeat-containing protein [Agromyces sp. LHK192]